MLEVFRDSMLVIKQVEGQFEVRKTKLFPYHQLVLRLMVKFYFIEVKHINRGQNTQADALKKLASFLEVPQDASLNISVINGR